MVASTFRETLGFLGNIGIFDVVLPFLLVFTITFALLEKTKVFGMEKVGDKEYTKKHLNSLAAFVIAFFVVASAELVEIITEISGNIVILIMASISFLLLAGSFHEERDKGYFLEGKFKNLFMAIMFIGLIFIFLNALKTDNGDTWLEVVMDAVGNFTDNVSVSSIVLLLIIVGFMYYVAQGFGPPKGESSKDH